jgi:hypothetical protein
MFKTALIVSGVVALIALAAPGLVIAGFFLLIVPGLILSLAPTVFVYLLLIGVIHWLLAAFPAVSSSVTRGAAGWVVSVVLAAAIGWVATLPQREVETLRWRAQLKPEIIPAEPLKLAGEVLLDQPPPLLRKHEAAVCDYLCAALLNTPGVTAVIAQQGDTRRRYALVPKGSAPDTGVRPLSPQGILDVFDRIDARARRAKYGNVRRFEETKAMQDAIAADWTLRLNTKETLVAEAVGADFKPDWTIRIVQNDERDAPQVDRVEVLDREGKAMLRRSLVTHRIFADFFAFAFVGGIENAHWEIARKTLSSGGRYASFDAPYELVSHVVLARPAAPADAKDELRSALVAALDDPNATPEQLLAARDWLAQLGFRIPEGDEPLVQRIAGDLRVPNIGALLRPRVGNNPPASFRQAFVSRVLDPATSAEDRRYYAYALAGMPVGTFASPTPDEQAIWNDPPRFADAAPFLERLADTRESGLQRLVALLRYAAAIDSWPKRERLILAVRRGFQRTGRSAAPALPVVLPLMSERPSPLMNDWRDRQEWNKTLILMGLPPERLPFPDSIAPQQAARDRQEAVDAAKRYDPDKRDYLGN